MDLTSADVREILQLIACWCGSCTHFSLSAHRAGRTTLHEQEKLHVL